MKSDAGAEEREKEENREKTKWDNYIPPEKRRPPDEFFDLSELKNAVRIEVVTRDSSITPITYDQVKDVSKDEIIKYLLQIGSGTLIQNTDDVYYKHETRHNNG